MKTQSVVSTPSTLRRNPWIRFATIAAICGLSIISLSQIRSIQPQAIIPLSSALDLLAQPADNILKIRNLER